MNICYATPVLRYRAVHEQNTALNGKGFHQFHAFNMLVQSCTATRGQSLAAVRYVLADMDLPAVCILFYHCSSCSFY